MSVMRLRRQLCYCGERFREGDLVAYEPDKAEDELCASDFSPVLSELYGKLVIEVAKERAHPSDFIVLREVRQVPGHPEYRWADAFEGADTTYVFIDAERTGFWQYGWVPDRSGRQIDQDEPRTPLGAVDALPEGRAVCLNHGYLWNFWATGENAPPLGRFILDSSERVKAMLHAAAAPKLAVIGEAPGEPEYPPFGDPELYRFYRQMRVANFGLTYGASDAQVDAALKSDGSDLGILASWDCAKPTWKTRFPLAASWAQRRRRIQAAALGAPPPESGLDGRPGLRDADLQRYYNKADALETQLLSAARRACEDSAESRQLELLSSTHDSATYRVKNGEVDEDLIRIIMEKLMPQQVSPLDSASKLAKQRIAAAWVEREIQHIATLTGFDAAAFAAAVNAWVQKHNLPDFTLTYGGDGAVSVEPYELLHAIAVRAFVIPEARVRAIVKNRVFRPLMQEPTPEQVKKLHEMFDEAKADPAWLPCYNSADAVLPRDLGFRQLDPDETLQPSDLIRRIIPGKPKACAFVPISTIPHPIIVMPPSYYRPMRLFRDDLRRLDVGETLKQGDAIAGCDPDLWWSCILLADASKPLSVDCIAAVYQRALTNPSGARVLAIIGKFWRGWIEDEHIHEPDLLLERLKTIRLVEPSGKFTPVFGGKPTVETVRTMLDVWTSAPIWIRRCWLSPVFAAVDHRVPEGQGDRFFRPIDGSKIDTSYPHTDPDGSALASSLPGDPYQVHHRLQVELGREPPGVVSTIEGGSAPDVRPDVEPLIQEQWGEEFSHD